MKRREEKRIVFNFLAWETGWMRGPFTEIRGTSRLVETCDILAFKAFTLLLIYGYIIILNISEV